MVPIKFSAGTIVFRDCMIIMDGRPIRSISAERIGDTFIRLYRSGGRYFNDVYHIPTGPVANYRSWFEFRARKKHENIVRRLNHAVIEPLDSPLWQKYQASYQTAEIGILCLEDLTDADAVLVKLRYG